MINDLVNAITAMMLVTTKDSNAPDKAVLMNLNKA